MTLAEWLKLQGAEIGDYFLFTGTIRRIFDTDNFDNFAYESMGYSEGAWTYPSQVIEPDNIQLYRMVGRTLQRINKKVITASCANCNSDVSLLAINAIWGAQYFCPDCEAKRKAQAVIKETLTTEKIKISPCPRCGSREINVFDCGVNNLPRYRQVRCHRCGWLDYINKWGDELESYLIWTDITDKYEVEK